MKLYYTSGGQIAKQLSGLRPALTTASERNAASQIEKDLAVWQPRFEQLKQLCAGGEVDAAYKLRNANKLISADMHSAARSLVDEQQRAAATARKRANDAYDRIAWAALLAAALLGGAGARVVRGTTGQLRQSIVDVHRGADHLAAAASRISSTSRQVAQGASDQAISLNDASASGSRMASMTRDNAEHSQQAALFVKDLNLKVQEAGVNLRGMVRSMSEIAESSGRISKIIRVIDAIAFQTNILALNAAVEAARAGTAGAGFAVVADEVRNLALRSTEAARDTAALIEESIAKSEEGGLKLSEVAASIGGIAESAESVRDLVEAVDAASRDQAAGIERIAHSISRMDEVTRRTAANAQASAGESDELSAQSESLRDVVDRLRLLIGSGERDFDSVST